jgi:hypothetical protein
MQLIFYLTFDNLFVLYLKNRFSCDYPPDQSEQWQLITITITIT